MYETYFAASNSGAGFVSYYGEIFDPSRFDRLYLIKGGPGTGKSSLMRRVALEAERRGLPVRRYACSSDPDSLDGVVVGDRFAMLDSTAPHTQDTALPGAADELVDLGRFWDAGELARARGEIAALNRRKKEAYARAYCWLGGVQACDRNTVCMLEGCVDHDKLRRAVRRCLHGAVPGEGRVMPALIDSVGMRGRVCFDSMHADAERAFILTETRGGGTLFLREALAQARELRCDVEAAWAPVEPTQLNGIRLPIDGVAILDEGCAGEAREGDKIINMSRFWLPERLRAVRTELRHTARCREQLMAGASLAFDDARAAHFAIEQIYIAAMDFAALNDYRDELLARIFTDASR